MKKHSTISPMRRKQMDDTYHLLNLLMYFRIIDNFYITGMRFIPLKSSWESK